MADGKLLVNDLGPKSHARTPTADSEPRTAPLRIEYTTTHIAKDAAAYIRARPGIVGPERSPLSDAFKILRVQLFQKMRPMGWNSVAVTSVAPSLNKSMSAINLALSIAAEFDKTALLVDANLGHPQVATLFGLGPIGGFTDHILDGIPLADLIVNPGIENLVILPAGRTIARSAELWGMDASTQLIAELKARYQQRYIVFDAPPVVSPEGLSLFGKVDAVLLVAERNVTSRQELEEARELLAPFNVLGSVLCDPLPEEMAAKPKAPPARRPVRRR